MTIGRREFLSVSVQSAAWGVLADVTHGERPLSRVGLLTDTHIDDRPESCRHVAEAFRVFRREKVDTILHAGDLATVWSPDGYREYRRLFHEIFAGSEPRELFSYGQHDGVRFPTELKPGEKWYDVKWPAFAKAMETDQPYQLETTLAGFPLIVFPQKWVEHEYDHLLEMIDRASRKNPDGPVFVLRHMPINDTVRRSDAFDCALGDPGRMAKYPNVIMLTGHIHLDLRDECAIWQQGFTAVDLGTLQWPRRSLVGSETSVYQGDIFMTMDVFRDRAEFTRWKLPEGLPYGDKWVVRWGLHPEELGAAARRLREPEGRFPSGAEVAVERLDDGGVKVAFPDVRPNRFVHRYVVEARKNGRLVALAEARGPWQVRDKVQDGVPSVVFPEGVFRSGEVVEFKVTPVTFHGKSGESLSGSWTVLSAVRRTDFVWRGSLTPVRCAKYPFGFRFSPPPEVWKGAKGTCFRIVFDLAAEADGRMWAYDEKAGQILGSHMAGLVVSRTVVDDALRYSLEFSKPSADGTYALYFSQTKASWAKLAVRIERILS